MNNERPLISFCLFAYNQENLIKEAVEGAFSQTYSPLEIVLSDDCSSDRTFEIIQEMAAEYSGPHKVILNRNEQNMGLVPHVNKVCMQIASGEILVISAGDDISYPQRAQRIYDEFSSRGDKLMMVFSYFDVIDLNGKGLPLLTDRMNHMSDSVATKLGEFNFKSSYAPGCSMALRKNVITYFGKLNEGVVAEDNALFIRALLLGESVVIKDKLLKYRKNTGNMVPRDIEEHLVCKTSKGLYALGQLSDVNALFDVIRYQLKTNDISSITLLRTKQVLLKKLKKSFVEEELSKSFPKLSLKFYFKMWKWIPKQALKFTVYKLGFWKLFVKKHYPSDTLVE